MIISNKDAIKLVDLLKESKKINQKKTNVSFNDESATECEVNVVWKSKKPPFTMKGKTENVLCYVIAWTMGGKL